MRNFSGNFSAAARQSQTTQWMLYLKRSQITQHRHVKTSLSSSMHNVFKKHF